MRACALAPAQAWEGATAAELPRTAKKPQLAEHSVGDAGLSQGCDWLAMAAAALWASVWVWARDRKESVCVEVCLAPAPFCDQEAWGCCPCSSTWLGGAVGLTATPPEMDPHAWESGAHVPGPPPDWLGCSLILGSSVHRTSECCLAGTQARRGPGCLSASLETDLPYVLLQCFLILPPPPQSRPPPAEARCGLQHRCVRQGDGGRHPRGERARACIACALGRASLPFIFASKLRAQAGEAGEDEPCHALPMHLGLGTTPLRCTPAGQAPH